MEEIIELLNQFLMNDTKTDKEKQWALKQTDDITLKSIIKQCDTREFRLIGLFKHNDVLSLKNLPEYLKASQASSSRSASKLQKLGVINKFKSEDNQKEWQLRLTDNGKIILRIKEQLDSNNIHNLQEATSDFSEEDITKVIEFLKIVVNNDR